MISHISGKVLRVDDKSVIIQVGGIGYEVFGTQNVLKGASLSSDVEIWTYLAVRETSLELFGFETLAEKTMFEMLLGVSGIGPRSALATLDLAPVETLSQAIARGEVSYMTKISGIGKKTAEKIVIELRDKMDGLVGMVTTNQMQENVDAIDALIALGYSNTQAREALQSVSDDIINVDERIKHALRNINS
ncbi:MAG: Holliday junction branch migration protein RuvA [Candidatus Nomurabacteria bacterium]|nr:Holliday junction branch migration protein RuvA [Candidatus Nomurabacteria bacterium]